MENLYGYIGFVFLFKTGAMLDTYNMYLQWVTMR